MRKIYIAALAIGFGCLMPTLSRGQSTANYTFTKTTNGSLTDMSTGTTQLVAGAVDDGASSVTNIGFEFWFMGVRYTQFSVNSNGYLRLGATATATTQYALATNTSILLSAWGSDCVTGTTGKIHYKLLGSAPNRTLVVEFLNMTVIYDAAGAGPYSTYQINLSEATGNINYTYGTTIRNSSTGYNNGMEPQYIGFSTSTTSFATVNSGTLAVTTSGTTTSNQYTLGTAVPELTSAAEGSRVVYNFASTVAAPTAANYTAVTPVSASFNWTDNSSDEIGFVVYRSLDGGATYTYLTTTAANVTTYSITGMTPNTALNYKVCALRESISASTSASTTTLPPGNVTSNGTGGGLWSATATWSNGVIPSIADNVTIQNGDNITVDVNANANNLTIGSGTSGSILFEATTARTLTAAGSLTINTGASVMTNATGTQTGHILSVGGNLTNNGTLDLSTNANTAGANLTFTGASSNTFGGTGTTNNIMSMTMNKGTAFTNILELNTPTFTVKGATNDVSGFLTITNGTLKLSGSYTMTNRIFAAAAYTIPATGGLWVNNANFTVPGQAGNVTMNGMLRLSAGIYNIGTASGNSATLGAGSVTNIEGGTLNVAGRYGTAAAGTIISYSQSGGDVTVNQLGYSSTTLACFDLGTSSSSTVTISAGTITVQLANGSSSTALSFRNQAGVGSPAVTGGTVFLGNANSGAAKTFTIAGVFPNLELTNTSAAHSAVFGAPATYNNISLNVMINTGNTFDFGNYTYLFNGNSIVNNGTLTHNGASSRFITFKPATNITYSGTGLVTIPMTSLELQNDLNFTFDPASNSIVASRIIMFSGSFVNADHIKFGNGGTTTATLQIGNTTTPTAGGTFDVSPSFNLGTGGQNVSYLRTTNPIVSGPEINPSRILNNFTIDGNTNGVTLNGGDLNVTGTLTLTTNTLNLNSSTLTLGASAAAVGTLAANGGRTANGILKRWIPASIATTVFPIGTVANSKAASINFTVAPSAGGTLTAQWIGSSPGTTGLPLVSNPTITKVSKDGYWRIESGDGLTDGTYTATLVDSGATDVIDYTGLVLLKRTNGSSAWTAPGTTIAPTGSNAHPIIASSGITGFSEFGVGGGNTALPLRISNISGINIGTRNRIDWKSFEEGTTAQFNVERSQDGKNFEAIGIVKAKGNANTYNFWDDVPFSGNNFYRLISVDKNNDQYLSNTIKLNVASDENFKLQCYPNPAKDHIALSITGVIGNNAKIQLLDISGKVIKTWNEASNATTLDISDVSQGLYMIKYSDDAHTESIKISKN